MSQLQGSWDQDPFGIPGVRELAKLSGITLAAESNDAQIQQLFKVWGSQKAFANNIGQLPNALTADGKIPNAQVRQLLLDTGTLDAQPLRTIHGPVTYRQMPVRAKGLVTGGMINWMDLRCKELGQQHSSFALNLDAGVLALADMSRFCTTETEVDHPTVVRLGSRRITESEAMALWFKEQDPLYDFDVRPGEGSLEDQLLAAFCEVEPQSVYVATNANALHIPMLVRRVLRELWGPQFDGDPSCQLYFSCQARSLATNMAQHDDPAGFQRPLTVPSGLVRLIHEMHLFRQEAA